MVCTMMGGREIASPDEAAAVTALLRDPVEVGQFVEEAPCHPQPYLDLIQEREGRPCPRVELDDANRLASKLVMLSLNEHTRTAALGLAGAAPRGARRRAWERAAIALQSPAVVEWLNPTPKEEA